MEEIGLNSDVMKTKELQFRNERSKKTMTSFGATQKARHAQKIKQLSFKAKGVFLATGKRGKSP